MMRGWRNFLAALLPLAGILALPWAVFLLARWWKG
jgi:hypothetical protein